MIGYVEAARLQHIYTKGSPMLELQMFLVCLFVCLFVCLLHATLEIMFANPFIGFGYLCHVHHKNHSVVLIDARD